MQPTDKLRTPRGFVIGFGLAGVFWLCAIVAIGYLMSGN